MKVMLFGALTLSLGVSFVGCKDYDDDIKNLQGQIDGKVTPEQLQEKISTMQTALAEAKSDAAAAKEAAEAAKAAAAEAKDDAAAAKAEVALVAAEAKEAAIKAAEDKVAEMKREVEATLANKVDQTTFDALVLRVVALEGEVGAIIGHRLTSIAFVPQTNINGIPAIKFYSLSYVPQAFNGAHVENDPTTLDAGNTVVVDNNKTTIAYRLNPRMGVRVTDIGLPTFDCIVSTNEIATRSVDENKAGVNTPIAPVAGQTMVIENGVLKLKVAKTITENINREWLTVGATEKFYMASLNVPIAKEQWTAEETKSGVGPTVNSEYVRISESTVTPMLKQTGSIVAATHDLNTVDVNGKYIHYHDSTALYKSDLNVLVDHKIKWNATTDLKKMVEVCSTGDHTSLADYKEYGLSFRFAIAKGEYLKGSNNTDQQRFAEIDNATNGLLKSRTYDIGGVAQTAIGREPIIRAMLVDTVNNKLVAQRYIKIQFIKDVTPAKDLPEFAFPNSIISCLDVVNRFGTQQMNELIYRQVDETPGSGTGMSKETFHRIYTGMEIVSLTKDGIDILKAPLTWGTDGANYDVEFNLVPDPSNNESFNLIWNMNEEAVGKIVPAQSGVYVIKVAHKDPTSLHGDVTKTYKTTIEIPAQSFKYLGTYWQTGKIGEVFNVNPIVYNTGVDGANGTQNNRSHIKTDLMNGFLYEATSMKPANLAQFIQYIRECANVRFEFATDKFKDYAYLTGYTATANNTEMFNGSIEAASIKNTFGATALENQKNLPWDENEVLGTGNNEATSIIELAEASATDGTEAAKALIGKSVPVRLVVEYNTYNAASVKEFEVFFINPLTVDGQIGDMVQDAVINGSFVDVEKGLTFTDWNNYAVAKSAFSNPTDLQKFATALWAYYGVKDVVFNTAGVKTNMAWNADNSALIPTDGVTTGPLPTGRSLKQFAADKVTEVTANPVYLGYFNNDGTPVNLDYKMFIDVTVSYKWGSLNKKALQLDVLRAGGTPTR